MSGFSVWTVADNVATATTAAGTTAFKGSTFAAFVASKDSTAGALPTSVSDSLGNVYQQIVNLTYAFGSCTCAWYVCVNGMGSGTAGGHTFKANWATAKLNIGIAFIEIPNIYAGSVATPIPAGVQNTTGNSPITAPAINAVVGQTILNAFAGVVASSDTINNGGAPFTLLVSQQLNPHLNGAVSLAQPGSGGSYADTFTYSATDYTGALAFALTPGPPPILSDGTLTSAATAVSTGQNGQGMGPLAVGTLLDVLVFIRSSNVPLQLNLNDGSANNYALGLGPFGSVDAFVDNANGSLWYRFFCYATNGIALPTLTVSAQAGYFPTSMSIAVGSLFGLSSSLPLPAALAHAANSFSGANQVSGFTSVLPSANYLLSSWALSQTATVATAAPTPVSPFAAAGTAFLPLSSGGLTPTLLWQTQALAVGAGPYQAQAVYPGGGRAYTFLAALNYPGIVIPSYPLESTEYF